MLEAIQLAKQNVETGEGGPFGAVIVKNDLIIAKSANCVTKDNDPTAHAEIVAIRLACKSLDTFNLEGCIIYTSCEPCPMCLSAIYWAAIKKVYYGNSKEDAGKIGFDDAFIYEELKLKPENRKVKSQQLLTEKAILAFNLWEKSESKTTY